MVLGETCPAGNRLAGAGRGAGARGGGDIGPSADLQSTLQLHWGTDGSQPAAGLVRDAAGNLYGTAILGGDLACENGLGCGTVFKLDETGKETVLYSFTGGTDGSQPAAGLVQDVAGNLYGTTAGGGASAHGTVFKLKP